MLNKCLCLIAAVFVLQCSPERRVTVGVTRSAKSILTTFCLGYKGSKFSVLKTNTSQLQLLDANKDELMTVGFDPKNNVNRILISQPELFGQEVPEGLNKFVKLALGQPGVDSYLVRDHELRFEAYETGYLLRFRGVDQVIGDFLVIRFDKKMGKIQTSRGR